MDIAFPKLNILRLNRFMMCQSSRDVFDITRRKNIEGKLYGVLTIHARFLILRIFFIKWVNTCQINRTYLYVNITHHRCTLCLSYFILKL